MEWIRPASPTSPADIDPSAEASQIVTAHLWEYRVLLDANFQHHDQRYRLTNYSLLVIGGLSAAAAALYKNGALPDIFWVIDAVSFCLFISFIWQQAYADRLTARLSDYVLHFLCPQLRSALASADQCHLPQASYTMRWFDYFYRTQGPHSWSTLRSGRTGDVVIGASRYLIPVVGASATLAGLIYCSLLPQLPHAFLPEVLPAVVVLGLLAFTVTIVAAILNAIDVLRVAGPRKS